MQTRSERPDERGMVTVELALATGATAVLVALFAGVLGVLASQFGAQAAATDLARQAARGDQAAVAGVRGRLPSGAAVRLQSDRGGVSATVTIPARPWGKKLPEVVVTGRSSATWEPGEGPR